MAVSLFASASAKNLLPDMMLHASKGNWKYGSHMSPLWLLDMLPGLTLWTCAGAGVKSYAKGHMTYLLIRQFKLLLEDLSVCIELDQAVDPAPGQSLRSNDQQASPL